MINLMYVVLMAMLAINVSTDVLDGFTVIEDSLRRTAEGSAEGNGAIYATFEEQLRINPEKTRPWYQKAKEVKEMSQSLFLLAEQLRKEIIIQADGRRKATNAAFLLKNKENTEATAQVMLSPAKGRGRELYEAINDYREKVVGEIQDPVKREIIRKNLSTDVPSTVSGKDWTQYMFESMPAAGATAMLTKLESDIRYAEGEVLHELLKNIDAKDVRVNALDAFVIPNARTVVQGNRFRANIVMAAVDTTQVPAIYIDGKRQELQDGVYDIACQQTGNFTLKGYLETVDNDGETIRREFTQDYAVVAPTATVSADLMNVLYAGYENPVSVSVPGVPLSSVSASMTGGTLTQKAPGRYIAKPSAVGKDAVITVFSSETGRNQQMAQYTFQVRKLPEPAPYITLKDEKGRPELFRGGALQTTVLIDAERIEAAVDDGILHIPFRVISFEAVVFDNMGNAVPVPSDGAVFSKAQKDTFRRLARGRRLYISRMKAIGPDGIERRLNTSMEVIIR